MAEEAASARMDSEIEFRSRPRVFRKDEAYAIIRDFLLGEESDQILSERILAGHLGLGLGPVRSALERLRAEGLIVAAPNTGLRLPEVTAKEIIDFYEMRMVVECHIASAVAGRLTGEQSDRLEAILFDQERSAATRDTARYHQLDLDFHQTLVDCHGNSEMARALGQMRDKMYRLSRRLHRAHPERLAVNAAQHRSIVDAIRAGSGAEARARMDTHLTWGRAFTLDPDGRLSRS